MYLHGAYVWQRLTANYVSYDHIFHQYTVASFGLFSTTPGILNQELQNNYCWWICSFKLLKIYRRSFEMGFPSPSVKQEHILSSFKAVCKVSFSFKNHTTTGTQSLTVTLKNIFLALLKQHARFL